VVSRPHRWTSSTQTVTIVVPTQDQTTQVLLRPRRAEAFTQTARPGRTDTWAQTNRPPPISDAGTDMPVVHTLSTASQAGCYFDNDLIPPGAPRPPLPWSYSYDQFDQLLLAYPDVHPEDFVTFGVLKEQPRRSSVRDWGEVASVLAHMVGGRQPFVNELLIIVRRIQRLDRRDPMRITEETLLEVLLRERRRSLVPLGDGAFDTLAAPGGPLDPRRRPSPSSPSQPGLSGSARPQSPQSGPSRGRGRRRRPGPSPGPSGAQGGPRRPPPGFVDLTADDDEPMETPDSPSPNVSDNDAAMATDDEDAVLGPADDSSSDDGFPHV